MFSQMTLANGLRIIAERIPHYRSISIGLWFAAGSQYETTEQSGISHFIEHMLFKGTKNRTARQIAEVMDAVGGQLNAFTSKECTCFYVKVTDKYLELSMDVLSDLTLNSTFGEDEIAKEKGVVVEEILMADDTPEDVVSDLILMAQYGDQPIARPILGDEKSVRGFARQDILSYFNWLYRPDNCVLSICGNFDWDEVLSLAEKYFGAWEKSPLALPSYSTIASNPGELRREKDIEQLHLCLSFPGCADFSPEIFPLSIINAVFGGSMSSRLFQSIREERGLVYTVYSYPTSFKDTGVLVVYAGMSEGNISSVMQALQTEIALMSDKCMTKDEFDKAKEQLKGNYILGLESSSSRMSAMGRRLLLNGGAQSEEECIFKIDSISFDDVCRMSKEIFSSKYALALVGRDVDGIKL